MSHGIVLSLLLLPFGQMEDEFYQDFRGGGGMSPGLVLFGPDLEQVIRNDSKGLCITLPARWKNREAVGVSPRFRIYGDFEITLGYEILSAKEPPKGLGSGVKIWVKLGSEEFQAMTLAHLVRPKHGAGFVAIMATAGNGQNSNGQNSNGQKKIDRKSASTEAMRGRLRLSKLGSELSFLFAEEDQETFQELQRVNVKHDEVVALRISVISEDDSAELSVRFNDLRIRADDLPAAHAAPEGLGAWTVVLILLIAAGAVGFLFWQYRRWQRK